MKNHKLSRRDFLKLQGLAVGGLVLTGSSAASTALADETCPLGGPCIDPAADDQKNSLFDNLNPACTNEPLAEDELRITFLGTSCTPMLTQQGVSVYVEVGPTHVEQDNFGRAYHEPADYAMFDCGMGCLTNYIAAGIPYARLDKIFIAHLHADHMSDLSAIYCFGESANRKSPMYVWGPSKSGVEDPVTGEIHEDGLRESLEHLRALWRWHTESFSFTNNGYQEYNARLKTLKKDWGLPVEPVPVGKYAAYQDPPNDSYALVPIELNWKKYGKKPGDNIAYWNKTTGVKITHFPVIHTRKGSIGYKLEFTPPNVPGKTISLIYSSDTKPNRTMINQAAGIDVLIHEIVMPPDAWTAKFMHVDKSFIQPGPQLNYFTNVQNSSHTTQAAFGYLLSQIEPKPRLAIGTHFQATDDTIASACQTLDAFCIPRNMYTFALDFMIFNVTEETITQRRLDVSRHEYPGGYDPSRGKTLDEPKYHQHALDPAGNPIVIGDPEAQIDTRDGIPPGDSTYTRDGYGPGPLNQACN
ncbi:MAG: twin-arginine translocation signal domain-containing protein [Anaerolineales bacterium]|jgi:ribonuclease Z|nr:twin-arginine translocation signal domain-containing protein [Anaerolineales bacterium]